MGEREGRRRRGREGEEEGEVEKRKEEGGRGRERRRRGREGEKEGEVLKRRKRGRERRERKRGRRGRKEIIIHPLRRKSSGEVGIHFSSTLIHGHHQCGCAYEYMQYMRYASKCMRLYSALVIQHVNIKPQLTSVAMVERIVVSNTLSTSKISLVFRDNL